MMDKQKATIEALGLFGEAEAKLRTPVDTGHLRQSISHDTETTGTKSVAQIGSNVEYDPVVELGSEANNQPAQPHYMPAITENLSTFKSMIDKGMKV